MKILLTIFVLSLLLGCSEDISTISLIQGYDSMKNISEIESIEELQNEYENTLLLIKELESIKENEIVAAYESKKKAIEYLIEYLMNDDNLSYQSHVQYALHYDYLLTEYELK